MKPISNRFVSSALTQWQIAETVTLPATSPATVTNLGTPGMPVLQFGVPRGPSGDLSPTGSDITVGNVVVKGLLLSGKTGVVTGFGGGPRLSQGGWTAPAASHAIQWEDLAGGCDNVTGVLYVHVSSKGATARKNGVATVTVVKDADDPPDLMVTAMHMSPHLGRFDVGLDYNAIVVATDEDCSACWSFIAAV
jgi:hypothetical protein